MNKDMENTSQLFNQSLEKGLAVLKAFSAQRRTMNLGEVARAADISKSSAQRMAFTLEALGYLRKHSQTRRYQLTPKVMEIGCNYLGVDILIDCANPFLADLSNACDETVALTEPSDDQMVYVSLFPSHKYIPIHMPIGSRVPMYCTSSGRALLSARSDAEVAKVLMRTNRIKHTPNTQTELAVLQRMISEARECGFAFNSEEYYLGDITVGAPIVNNQGEGIAAVHIVAPSSRWTFEQAISRLGPRLIECARAISNAVRTID